MPYCVLSALLGVSLVLAGCGAAPIPNAGGAGTVGGLQADGSLHFQLGGVLPGGGSEGSLSAPLIANSGVFQYLGGAGYPSTDAARRAVVEKDVYAFDRLLALCQPKYPLIKLPAPGVTLTPDELATNFNQVARCSYYEYGGKPYFIPQLLDDLDVCAAKLGPHWRLPTQADLAAFQDADLVTLRDTLTGALRPDPLNGSPASWGTYYFSLKIYARDANGALVFGDLNPGSPLPRVKPLPVSGVHLKDLLIDDNGDNASLRCLRTE